MRGSILDFLKLASEKPELAGELVELARRYDFEFSDEVSDEELDGVSGGAAVKVVMESLTGGGLPDGMTGPPGSSSGAPIPYPNLSGNVGCDGKTVPSGVSFESGSAPDQSDPGIGSA